MIADAARTAAAVSVNFARTEAAHAHDWSVLSRIRYAPAYFACDEDTDEIVSAIAAATVGDTKKLMSRPQTFDMTVEMNIPMHWEWFYEYIFTTTDIVNPFTSPLLRKLFDGAKTECETLEEAVGARSIIVPRCMRRVEGPIQFKGRVKCSAGANFEGIDEQFVGFDATLFDGCPQPLVRHYLEAYFDTVPAFILALSMHHDNIAYSMMSKISHTYHHGAVCAYAYVHDCPRTIARVRAREGLAYDAFCMKTFARVRNEDFEFTASHLQEYLNVAPTTAYDDEYLNSDVNPTMLVGLFFTALNYGRMTLARTIVKTIADAEKADTTPYISTAVLRVYYSPIGHRMLSETTHAILGDMITKFSA